MDLGEAVVPPQQFPLACLSAGPAPARRLGSIRRTLSVDSEWPDGFGYSAQMTGRGRDLLTPADGTAPKVVGEGGFEIRCSVKREIEAIETYPPHPMASKLVGARAGGASRLALQSAMRDIVGDITYQLIDDFAGASLVANWAWTLWLPPRANKSQSSDQGAGQTKGVDPRLQKHGAGRNGAMEGVCVGFAPGSSSLLPDGSINQRDQSRARVGPLQHPSDPKSWHDMPEQKGPKFRRARRIDVWREGRLLKVDASFQDSSPYPEGGRMAIHEYRVFAEIEEDSGTLLALQAQPLILPYSECPGASIKATRMVGSPVKDFRLSVLRTLAATEGCTHLNDVLRALADVGAMARHLPR